KKGKDVEVTESKAKNIIFMGIISLTSLVMLTLVLQNFLNLSFLKISELSITGLNAMFFGVAMAIGEEDVFRDGLLNYFTQYSRGNLLIPQVLSATAFVAYHFGVYQEPSVWLFVFGAGLI